MQRADMIADRLRAAFTSGAQWQETQVLGRNGLWTVNIGDRLIATADVNSARAFGMQTGQLAGRWARQAVVAMGGNPQTIARQLMPIATAVAGAQQELGGNWMTAPVKSVPALDVSSGETMGNVTVAGSQDSLSKVSAVAVYAYATDSANAYVFTPSSRASVSDVTVPRVMGVGVVRIPADLIDMTNIDMGDAAVQAFNESPPAEWNAEINSRLASWQIQLTASTKVVPLYSLDMRHVVGAVQIVGDANSIGQAQTIVASNVNSSIQFGATSMPWNDISGRPTMLDGVVVSAIIVFPGTVAAPVAPEMLEETPTP